MVLRMSMAELAQAVQTCKARAFDLDTFRMLVKRLLAPGAENHGSIPLA
jgi:hypothetical protein